MTSLVSVSPKEQRLRAAVLPPGPCIGRRAVSRFAEHGCVLS